MNYLSLQQVPNQSLSVVLEGNYYIIQIVYAAGTMAVTITRNDEIIVSGQRAIAEQWLIPYRYAWEGNFMFLNLNDELISYENFGSSQNLVYFSVADLNYLTGG